MPDQAAALHAPATARNREPIREVLRQILPARGLLLELAAGTGEHAAYFAGCFPGVIWCPSDPDPRMRASIAAHAAAVGLANLRPPLDLDVRRSTWPAIAQQQLESVPAALMAVNLLHIAPADAGEGLLRGAGTLLPAGAPLYLYGPFRRAGKPTAPSNEAFDARLRAENPDWGLRLLEDLLSQATTYGLDLDRICEMPANNLSVILRRR